MFYSLSLISNHKLMHQFTPRILIGAKNSIIIDPTDIKWVKTRWEPIKKNTAKNYGG